MKKKEVIEFIEAGKNNLFASTRGTKLVYAIHRNMAKLSSLYESIKKMGEPGEEFKPFLKAQWELFEKYGEKLPSGQLKVISVDGKFDVTIPTKNQKQYAAADKAMKEEFEEVILKYNQFNKKYDEFIQTDIEPEDQERIHMVKYDDLPDNLTFRQLEILNFMISE